MNATAGRAPGGWRPSPRRTFAILCLALASAALAAATAAASAPAWRPCLECHAEAGLSAAAAGGEIVSLAVSAAELAGSAHRTVECRGCHPSVRLDRHPSGGELPDPAAYRTAVSGYCVSCHSANRLRAKSQHAGVAFESLALSCAGCHGSHGVKTVAELKAGTSQNEYCLVCHAGTLSLRQASGERVSLDVDPAKLKASVHPNHECSACHAGFSKEEHPAGAPEDRGSRSAAVERSCGYCHAEKLVQGAGSIHFALLRSGQEGAPGCTDCHSAHEVAPRERFATLAGLPCRGCHEQIFAAYAGSMHGQAASSGAHLDAPLCSDCHLAHQTQVAARPERVRAACIVCHPTAVAVHAVWLPNTSLHLDAVSCAVCHAPTARRVVALRLVEEGTGRAVTEREIGNLLGGTAAAALDAGGDGVDGRELWSLLRRLETGRGPLAAKLKIVGSLEVARGIDAHRLAGKTGAVRACETCHESGSPSFNQVAMILTRDDGRSKRFDAAPEVLTDAASVVSVRGFYALGGTRHGALDWLLVLAVAGGLSVIAGHLSMRLWAARAGKKG